MFLLLRQTTKQLSANTVNSSSHFKRRSSFHWTSSCVVRLSSESLPTIDRLSTAISTNCRPSVDRLSTAISTDRLVDTTYSKHDPFILALYGILQVEFGKIIQKITGDELKFHFVAFGDGSSGPLSKLGCNSQGHPTTVSSKICWKHFLGYPECF